MNNSLSGAEKAVKQRRFPYIWASNDGHNGTSAHEGILRISEVKIPNQAESSNETREGCHLNRIARLTLRMPRGAVRTKKEMRARRSLPVLPLFTKLGHNEVLDARDNFREYLGGSGLRDR